MPVRIFNRDIFQHVSIIEQIERLTPILTWLQYTLRWRGVECVIPPECEFKFLEIKKRKDCLSSSLSGLFSSFIKHLFCICLCERKKNGVITLPLPSMTL